MNKMTVSQRHQRQFFRSVSIFSRLSDDSLAEVMAGFHMRLISRDAFLFMEGEESASFFIVAAGRVRLFKTSPKGREFTITLRHARQFFDLSPVFDGRPYSVSASALTNLRLYVTPLQHIQTMMARFPVLNRALEIQLAEMLRRMADVASDMAFTDVSTRLARLILVSARNDGRETPDGISVEWGLSQSEIAHLLGTAREVVSRNLRSLEKERLVERTHSGILIRDWRALERKARR